MCTQPAGPFFSSSRENKLFSQSDLDLAPFKKFVQNLDSLTACVQHRRSSVSCSAQTTGAVTVRRRFDSGLSRPRSSDDKHCMATDHCTLTLLRTVLFSACIQVMNGLRPVAGWSTLSCRMRAYVLAYVGGCVCACGPITTGPCSYGDTSLGKKGPGPASA